MIRIFGSYYPRGNVAAVAFAAFAVALSCIVLAAITLPGALRDEVLAEPTPRSRRVPSAWECNNGVCFKIDTPTPEPIPERGS